MDKISVIVPIYNVEPYIRQCLDSIVNQTYQNLEIILVDDGSPDNCGVICDEYAEKDGRIIVIHKKNGGLSAARNDGIEQASGDWIAFVDSDDWCELDYYEKLIKAVDGCKADVVCAGGYYLEYSERNRKMHTFFREQQLSDRRSIELLMEKVLAPVQYKGQKKSVAYGYPWDKLYRFSFIRECGILFDVDINAWEDLWFNFQCFNASKAVVVCTFIGYHYRQMITSITTGFNPNKPKIMCDVISKMYFYMNQHGLKDKMLLPLEVSVISAIATTLNCYYFHPDNLKPYALIARELKKIKTWPYFYEAIYAKHNRYLAKKQMVLKYTLRLPWIWPVKLLHMGNALLK